MDQSTKEAKPPSPQPVSGAFPPDVARLLDVLARIERRRQMQLRQVRLREAS